MRREAREGTVEGIGTREILIVGKEESTLMVTHIS